MEAELEELKAMWLALRAHVDQLAGERQQYVDFFEQSPEAYVVTDAVGMIREVNGAAVDILGRRKRYLRGKPLTVLVALEQRPEFRRRMRGLAAGSTSERTWRTTLLSPESATEVRVTGRLMGRPDGAAGICWLLQAA